MIPDDFLEILRCPQTQQSLAIADARALASANARLAAAGSAGDVEGVPAAGETSRETLSEALIRADGAVLYPIRHGIPILLADEAIAL